MLLQEIYYIAEMVVGVAVIISIIFVAIELRQNTYMLRKSQADQRRQHFNWIYPCTFFLIQFCYEKKAHIRTILKCIILKIDQNDPYVLWAKYQPYQLIKRIHIVKIVALPIFNTKKIIQLYVWLLMYYLSLHNYFTAKNQFKTMKRSTCNDWKCFKWWETMAIKMFVNERTMHLPSWSRYKESR